MCFKDCYEDFFQRRLSGDWLFGHLNNWKHISLWAWFPLDWPTSNPRILESSSCWWWAEGHRCFMTWKRSLREWVAGRRAKCFDDTSSNQKTFTSLHFVLWTHSERCFMMKMTKENESDSSPWKKLSKYILLFLLSSLHWIKQNSHLEFMLILVLCFPILKHG